MNNICPISKDKISLLTAMEEAIFSSPWSQKALETYTDSPYAVGLILFCNEEAAGYVIGTCLAGEGELLRIGIRNPFRKQGLASALLESFLEHCTKARCESVFLEVREHNLPARSLYEKHGFESIGIRKNYYSDPTENAVLYQKSFTKDKTL